jgi:23S rRNA (guanosine2251-2'-O)-methyltransferase
VAHEVDTFLFGRRAVLEALRARVPVRQVLVARGVRENKLLTEIRSRATKQGITVRSVDKRALGKVTADGHQGVAAEIAPYRYAELETMLCLPDKKGGPPLLLMLDCLQDVQNFGSLLRTAEAVGVDGVVIPRHRSVSVTPALYKTSAGAVHYLRIARVPNLSRAIRAAQAAGLWVVGLDTEGETCFDEADLGGPLVVVVGSEGKGLSRLVRERCDLRVRLPMAGHVQSLNAAVAGSIVLYEAWKQRQ